MNKIFNADCLEILRTLEANSVDLVVTDPPYALGFMQKAWDKAVPNIDIWSECLRVLKPGAFAFIMSSPRQDCLERMLVNVRSAGFATNFTSLYWAYQQGFPKAMNIGLACDKRLGVESRVVATITTHDIRNNSLMEASTPELKKSKQQMEYQVREPVSAPGIRYRNSYAGYQPKPAVEVIIVAMKPLSEKNYLDQAMLTGKGITYLGDCRIPHDEEIIETMRTVPKSDGIHMNTFSENTRLASPDPKGRFPANLLVSSEAIPEHEYFSLDKWAEQRGINGALERRKRVFVCSPLKGIDTELNSMMDNLSRATEYARYVISQGHVPIAPHLYFTKLLNDDDPVQRELGIQMGLDLLDTCDELWVFGSAISEGMQREIDHWLRTRNSTDIINVPKVSASERNRGCEELDERFSPTMNNGLGVSPQDPLAGTRKRNVHPTLKPLKLFSYLVTLGSAPNDTVLDPFCGSGTLCLAAKQLNRNYIGIEIDSEYCKIANARLNNIPVQVSLFDL